MPAVNFIEPKRPCYPPVSRIPRDVLWEIFDSCISVFPLETDTVLLFFSNVCREWRSLILESPSLWRKVVNTWHLDDSWGDEVMRRTGTAPLWVRGDSTYPIFIGFLSRYWDRIERLSVSAPIDTTRADEDFQVFYRPAPYLTYCKVRLSGLKNGVIPTRLRNIFGDMAPNLRELRAPLPFAKADCLTQIRVMEFPNFFSSAEVFDALSQMTVIEDATIQTSRILIPLPRTHILLPRLLHLRLKGSLLGCLTFMKNLTPAPGCSVLISMKPPYPEFEAFFEEAVQQVPRYVQNCFVHVTDFDIRLDFKGQDVVYYAVSDASHFSISIKRWPELNMKCIPALECFIHFAHAKTLTLDVTEFERGLHPVIQSLASFFFRSITCLDIDVGGEVLGIMAPTASWIPFPMLQTIKAHSFQGGDEDETKRQTATLVEFIVQREKYGCPVSLLEISFLGNQFADLSRLEQVIGLTVQWQVDEGSISEYICGTGSSDKLRIKPKVYLQLS